MRQHTAAALAEIHTLLRGVAGELGDLGLGRVLAQSTEQVTKVLARDVTRALLVEERESLLVLSLRLRTVVSTGTRFKAYLPLCSGQCSKVAVC